MKKNDRLFDLIRTLTKNEKGYFKKFSQANSQKEDSNQYIQLFDAIDKQKEYDEDLLVGKFAKGNKKFNFSAAKNFLYDRILNSLESYHSQRVSGEIRSYMNQVEILMQKLLHQQAEKLLEKAEHLAIKHEMDELMPPILLRRIMLWKVRKYSGVSPEEMEAVMARLRLHLKHIGQLSEVYHYQFLYDSGFTSRGALADKENQQAFSQLIQNMEESGISDSGSFPVQASYLLLLHSMYMFSDQAESAYQANLKLLEMFENNPSQIGHRRNQYHHTLARIVETQAGLHHFTEASQNLQKLRESSSAHVTNTDAHFWAYYILLLNIMLSREMHDFKTLLRLMEENQDMLYPKIVDNRNGDIQLKMHAAQIYFYWGRYDTVLDLLNDVLNNPRNGVRTDFYCYAKVLLLITYWEMGNLSIMPYELKSTRNFFETRLALIDSDRIILRFIEKNLQKDINSRSLVEPFRQLKQELENSYTDKFNKRPSEYIDALLWAESKIQRVPMTETKASTVNLA